VEIEIAEATDRDLDAIKSLLRANDLPLAGVDEHWSAFILAREGEEIVACGGAEAYPSSALLRSIAVRPEYRRHGLARNIVRKLVERLSAQGIREFYLLTTTAAAYFEKRGFEVIGRDHVDPALLSSREFQDACPKSATCMRLVALV
jgi:N-acetylglutamate synthase-like GNAT family acetyltransferase